MDRTFYDIGTTDLKELWDSDLDPVSSVLFYVCKQLRLRKYL